MKSKYKVIKVFRGILEALLIILGLIALIYSFGWQYWAPKGKYIFLLIYIIGLIGFALLISGMYLASKKK